MSERSSDQVEGQKAPAEDAGGRDQVGVEGQPMPAGPEAGAPAAEEALDAEGAGVEGVSAPGDGPPPEVPGPEPEDELSEPEGELEVATRERAEYLALAQRTQADFENYRKRAAKEAAAAGRRAKSGLVAELLPVVDNLERALASAGGQEEHLAGGVRLVHSELISVLARNGVEQFDPAGEKFDPSFHEALSTREEAGAAAGTVVDVVEKGYSLNGAVLRPARVVVSG